MNATRLAKALGTRLAKMATIFRYFMFGKYSSLVSKAGAACMYFYLKLI
jgi:hypothetical protein